MSSGLVDSVITTLSNEPSLIIDSLITNTPVTIATATSTATITNMSHDTTTTTTATVDDITHSTSTVQQNNNNSTDVDSPAVLGNNATDATSGSHDAESHDANSTMNNGGPHNNSLGNITEGSGDPVHTNNIRDNNTVTSHTNGTNEEDDDDSTNGDEFADLPTTHQPPLTIAGQQPKSSVLIRLSNRIKELEVNMSLFGDYLERVRTRCICNRNHIV